MTDNSHPDPANPSEPKTNRLPSHSLHRNSFALTGLLVLAIFYTLYFTRLFLLPLVLALLFSLLLSPLVRVLRRLRLPDGLSSGLVVLFLLGIISSLGYLLVDPAAEWIERAPSSLAQIEEKLRTFKKPVEKVTQATEEMEKLTQVGGKEEKKPSVQVKGESLSWVILGRVRTMTAGIVVIFVLLYFLLASGDLFLRKLIRVLTTLDDKKRAVEIARHLQEDISMYLLTITLINFGLGAAVGFSMYLLEMPNPLLWGAVAAILNFIPYLGALVGVGVITVASVLTFDLPREILWPPLAYFLLTAAEGYFVTPLVLGRRFTLNPVVILLGLIFWGWLWGIIGAVLAVPILVSFKIFCEHIPPLEPWGEFLAK